MKILHVVDNFNEKAKSAHPPKGISENLCLRGHDTEVFTSNIDITPTKVLSENKPIVTKVKRFWGARFSGKTFFPGLVFGLLAKKNPDIVISYIMGSFSTFVAGYIKLLKGYKLCVVADFDANEPVPGILKLPYTLLFRVFPAKIAEMVIVFTEEQKKELVKRYRFNPEKISVVPIGIYPCDFSGKKENVFAKEELLRGKTIVLNVSHLVPKKNIEMALSAFSRLKDSKLSFVHLGAHSDRKYFSYLEKKAKELGLEGKVLFISGVPPEKIPFYYSSADILVQTGFKESFSIPLLEAMASGLPIVSTPAGIAPSVVKDGETGFIVKNESELAEKLSLLEKNPGLRKKMSANCKEAAKEFGWEKITERLEKIFSRL